MISQISPESSESQRLLLRAKVRELLDRRGDERGFNDQELMLTHGRLDSLSVVELISFLESRFHLDLKGYEFDARDFESVDSLLSFISRRRSG